MKISKFYGDQAFCSIGGGFLSVIGTGRFNAKWMQITSGSLGQMYFFSTLEIWSFKKCKSSKNNDYLFVFF